MYLINEVSEMLDLPASTIRYYDSKGLLPYVERDSSGRRLFSDVDVELLAAFKRGIGSGLTLKEMRELFDIVMVDQDLVKGRAFLLEKKKSLQREILKLGACIRFLEQTISIYDKEIEKLSQPTGETGGTSC